jgi:hypothetical protein
MCHTRALPTRIGQRGQRGEAHHQGGDVSDGLPTGRQFFMQPVSVKVAQQEHHLKEQHAGAPHRRRAAKPWQDHLGDDRLHLKKKECGKKNGQGVK